MAPSSASFAILALALFLFAVGPTAATRSTLESSPAGIYQQCGGKGGSCSGTQCKDGAVAACAAGTTCWRISEYYWMCDNQKPKPAPSAPVPAGAYTQCGGSGNNCSGAKCGDHVWPGAKCPAGFACDRMSQYYWMCDNQKPAQTPTPAPKPPPAGAYKQCGGSGNGCKGSKCKDAVWPGAKCPTGFKCYRVSQYYRQCDTHPLKQSPAGAYKQCGGAGNGCKGSKCKDAAWPGAKCPKGFSCERVSKWYWQCDTHKLD